MPGILPNSRLKELTRDWGCLSSVELYLESCQVDTPTSLVRSTWDHVLKLRDFPGLVVDYGAGDGRFAHGGRYRRYVGFEVDEARSRHAELPSNADLVNGCAFSAGPIAADVCIGNPPFVRNQNLPSGWRLKASEVIHERTGVRLSGLANAWQYFFFLALASVHDGGICALVVPYEWVSRPSARQLREYIRAQGWTVSVYRLVDSTFSSVLTTASITIVDKADRSGTWRFFEEDARGAYRELPSATGHEAGILHYLRRSEVDRRGPRAVRGLSPGTQRLLTLTEGERIHFGLSPGRDVVPCVTTLRNLPADLARLDTDGFSRHYRNSGEKCWLVETGGEPAPALSRYLDSRPEAERQTATCLERKTWWRFSMPPVPSVLMAMSFRGPFPKFVENAVGARAVGGVCGIYDLNPGETAELAAAAAKVDLRQRVVAHSKGLHKIEINQLNAFLRGVLAARAAEA